MKYIRTKDGRILVADDNSLMAKLTTNKVADTIEELCDGFVVISEEYVEPHYIKGLIDTNALDFKNHWRPYGNGKVLNKFCQELIDAVIYGAIWTDEGLIYVAKMNDKGELELLWVKK